MAAGYIRRDLYRQALDCVAMLEQRGRALKSAHDLHAANVFRDILTTPRVERTLTRPAAKRGFWIAVDYCIRRLRATSAR
jgi:hypothetical protein